MFKTVFEWYCRISFWSRNLSIIMFWIVTSVIFVYQAWMLDTTMTVNLWFRIGFDVVAAITFVAAAETTLLWTTRDK